MVNAHQNHSKPDAFDASGPTLGDVLCRRCGYNLRGLLREMFCPECGAPVEQSLREDYLRYADPEWLRRVRMGLFLVLLSLFAGFFASLLGGMAAAMAGNRVAVLLNLAVGGFVLWAMFLITAPEPRLALTEGSLTLRRWIRIFAIAQFAGSLLTSLGVDPRSAGVGALGNNPNAAVVTSGAALVLGSILSLAAIGTHFTFLMYLRRLALRIPNQKLANAARIVMCGFVICMGVLLLAGVLVAALASRNQGGGGGGPALGTAGSGATGSGMMGVGVFGFFACFGGAGLIVFQIWYLIMLVRFRSAFREAELAAIRFAVHRPRVIPPPPGGGETGSGSGETG